MKRPKAKARKRSKPSKRGFALIERRLPHRRLVEFPQMKGRTVEKIELFTAAEFHSLTITFQDKTALNFSIVPCFVLDATFSDVSPDDMRAIKEWPPIHNIINRNVDGKPGDYS
jgi:hypothetical protein